MRHRVALLALLIACSAAGPKTAVAFVQGSTGRLVLRVEIAATPEERSTGLMGRRSLPAGSGMLFDYGGATSTGGFWMKNTLIPLDIAFIRDRFVTQVSTMIPCRSDPCPLTIAAGPYHYAVEAAAGTFAAAGIGPGARVVITRVT